MQVVSWIPHPLHICTFPSLLRKKKKIHTRNFPALSTAWFWIWYSPPAGLIHLCSHANYGQKTDVLQLFLCSYLCQRCIQWWMFLFAKSRVVRWQQPAVPHTRCELQTQPRAPIPRPATARSLRKQWRYILLCEGRTTWWFWEQPWCTPNGAASRPLKATDDLLKTVLWEVRLGTEVKNKRTGVCTSSYLHLLHMKGHCTLCW